MPYPFVVGVYWKNPVSQPIESPQGAPLLPLLNNITWGKLDTCQVRQPWYTCKLTSTYYTLYKYIVNVFWKKVLLIISSLYLATLINHLVSWSLLASYITGSTCIKIDKLNIYSLGINPRNSAKKDSPNSLWNSPLGKPSGGALPSVGAKNTALGKSGKLWNSSSICSFMHSKLWIVFILWKIKSCDCDTKLIDL